MEKLRGLTERKVVGARLDKRQKLTEESRLPQRSVSQRGGSSRGRGVYGVPEEKVHFYYGQAVLKYPVWYWEIPWYFFADGLARASSALALVAGVGVTRSPRGAPDS
jgi:hypothetical protein